MGLRRMSVFAVLSCVMVLAAAGSAWAGYSPHRYVAANGYDLPYWIYVPDNYDPAQSYPLLIYLHCSGNSGTNNVGPSSHPSASALVNVARQPGTEAFVLVPQTATGWQYNSAGSKAVFDLIDTHLIDNQQYNLDTDRFYITGFSLGGVGIFDWVGNEPDRWAAVAPFAGALYFVADNPTHAANRAQVAMWACSGALDGTVTPASTLAALSAQAAYGGDPLMSTYAGAGHSDTWRRVESEEIGLYSWMLAQRNGTLNDMSMFVGWETNTSETVTLNGPAQSVVRTDPYFVGYYGTGTFQVLNGATMTNTTGYMAAQKYGRGNVVVDGEGSQWINHGTLYVGHTNPASLHVANGARVTAAETVVSALSYLSGNGTIVGDVRMSGRLRPGDVSESLTALPTPGTIGGRRPLPVPLEGGALSVPLDAMGAPGSATGVLTIDGNLTQFPSGVLEIELGGTARGEYDAIDVKGTANMVGKLAISLIDGFHPDVGDIFEIVTANARTGTFASVDGLRIGGGRRLEVLYTAESILLNTLMGIPGDANNNGIVSMVDFEILKSNFGVTHGATWEMGDFNGDGAVDLDDFMLLKQNFGAGSVPEPATMLLMASGAGLILRRRR